jgi:tRNA G18 (ribose-2'-O)-methylase SpoU
MRVQPITSFDDPNLAPYRTLRRPLEHREQGIFVAEGEKVVRRLLLSNFQIISALLTPKWHETLEPLLRARAEDIQIYVAEKELLETLTGFSMFQGLLAVGRIPAPTSLAQVLQTNPRPYLLVAIDALANAENLGTLVRNATAFGAQAILVGETSSSPFLRRAVRSSMGTIFKMPAVETNSLVQTLRELQAHGITCVAAHPHAEHKTLAQVDFRQDCCLVFGSEGHGIAPQVLAACDDSAMIPMAAGVDSLNVGSAAAVFLYEVARQRGRMTNDLGLIKTQ